MRNIMVRLMKMMITMMMMVTTMIRMMVVVVVATMMVMRRKMLKMRMLMMMLMKIRMMIFTQRTGMGREHHMFCYSNGETVIGLKLKERKTAFLYSHWAEERGPFKQNVFTDIGILGTNV